MKLIQLLQFRDNIEGSDFFLTRVTCWHLLKRKFPNWNGHALCSY